MTGKIPVHISSACHNLSFENNLQLYEYLRAACTLSYTDDNEARKFSGKVTCLPQKYSKASPIWPITLSSQRKGFAGTHSSLLWVLSITATKQYG